MNRYLKSFLLAGVVYSSVFASIFIEFEDNKGMNEKKTYQKIQMQDYKITPPTPPKEPQIQKPKQIEKPVVTKPAPQPPKQIEKKPKIQKPKEVKLEKKSKEIKKTKQPKVQKVEKTKQPPKKPQKPQKQKKQPQTDTKTKPSVDKTPKKQYLPQDKEAFLHYIRNSIQNNKAYPKVAQRRGIEGSVDISFTVCQKGTLQELTTDASHRYFDKTTQEAIEKIFPLDYALEKVKLPMRLNLVVEYKLR